VGNTVIEIAGGGNTRGVRSDHQTKGRLDGRVGGDRGKKTCRGRSCEQTKRNANLLKKWVIEVANTG